MNPKDFSQNVSENLRGQWFRVKPSYRAAGIIALVALLWMASGVLSPDIPAPPKTVEAQVVPRVQAVESHAVAHIRTIAIYGRVAAGRGVDLKAEFDASVAEVVAVKGSKVKTGDILVRFEDDGRGAHLTESRARLEQMTIAFEASRKLAQEGFRSKINTAGAKADLEGARAAVLRAESDDQATTLRAPFDGVVDDIPVEVGDFVTKGHAAARVIDLTRLKVIGEVAERDAAKVAVGSEARVTLMDSRELLGLVTFASRTSNIGTRTYRVEVTVENTGDLIPEGVTATIRVPMETTMAHLLSPALLTLSDEGQLGVKTVEADGLVGFYAVAMVSDTRDGIWLAGLPDTVRIITVGQEFVRPGLKVIAVDGKAPALATATPPEG